MEICTAARRPLPPRSGASQPKSTLSADDLPLGKVYFSMRISVKLRLQSISLKRSSRMAHKKIERSKELQRKRRRRQDRLRQRLKDARAAVKA
jgi:hypothetical protein